MNNLVWYPKSVTFIVNGIEYKDYKTPMSYFMATIIWINLLNQNK